MIIHVWAKHLMQKHNMDLHTDEVFGKVTENVVSFSLLFTSFNSVLLVQLHFLSSNAEWPTCLIPKFSSY